MLLDRHTMLNAITDVWEPHYSSNAVYIATHKIDRSRFDIKLRFQKVGPTSAYAGDWFITRKKAKSFRKQYNNNHQMCYIIPWEAFEPLTLDPRSLHDIY